jgi:ankyrin repeat protein
MNQLIKHIRRNEIDDVEWMLTSNRYDVDIDKPDSKGMTPLMYAIEEEHPSMIELLINLGADIEKVNSSGQNALEMAEAQKSELVENLQAEMDLGIPDPEYKQLLENLIINTQRMIDIIKEKQREIDLRKWMAIQELTRIPNENISDDMVNNLFYKAPSDVIRSVLNKLGKRKASKRAGRKASKRKGPNKKRM